MKPSVQYNDRIGHASADIAGIDYDQIAQKCNLGERYTIIGISELECLYEFKLSRHFKCLPLKFGKYSIIPLLIGLEISNDDIELFLSK